MSLFSDALERLRKYNLGPFNILSNAWGLTGAGGPDTNLEPMLGDIATVGSTTADLAEQVQQALTEGQASADAAEDSAVASAIAMEGAQEAQEGSEAARDKAQAWAESATAPGTVGTKSAKSWSTTAQAWAESAGEPGAAGSKSAKGWADYGQTVVLAWAEGAGEPGGVGTGTKSAKGWATYTQQLIAGIAGGPVASIEGYTGVVSGKLAKIDLSNVTNADFVAKATASGVGIGGLNWSRHLLSM